MHLASSMENKPFGVLFKFWIPLLLIIYTNSPTVGMQSK
jgi:hypothetical protein